MINTRVSQPLTDVEREDLVRALGRHETTGSYKAQMKKKNLPRAENASPLSEMVSDSFRALLITFTL